MKRVTPPVLLLVAALGLAGCGQRAEDAPDPAAPGTAAGPATSSTGREASGAAAPGPASPEAPDAAFDKGAFSGVFANGRHRLELHADGTYILDAPDESGQGTWTHEAKDGLIRLDPGSKDAQDRAFRVQGKDQLVPMGDPALAPFPTLARLAAS